MPLFPLVLLVATSNVSVSVTGADAEAITRGLEEQLRTVNDDDDDDDGAAFFVVVTEVAAGTHAVEVNDQSGLISRQEVQAVDDDQAAVLIALVVLSAIDRARKASVGAPVLPVMPALPASPPVAPLAPMVVPHVGLFALAAAGDSLVLEGGPRVDAGLGVMGLADVAVDVGYRSQFVAGEPVHAIPIGLTLGLGWGAASVGVRAEATPKLVAHDGRVVFEAAFGPELRVSLPVPAIDDVAGVLVIGAQGKVLRQRFLLDEATILESPWRGYAAVGLSWQWD
ncbi:MAG: hypothetical protein Q8O67_08220 [Deltaproteobacteria bacterium]|nr:hypothetical protein [Deltaproteobacteria bacterium]